MRQSSKAAHLLKVSVKFYELLFYYLLVVDSFLNNLNLEEEKVLTEFAS